MNPLKENIHEITTLKELDYLIKNNKCAILKASAVWCKPCKLIEPFFNELINSLDNDICIIKIDLDKATEIKRKLRIQAVPYMANFFNSEVMDIINTSNRDMIRKFINKTEEKYDMLKSD
tara:strand:- start:3260 stop:3619 length:360 start_codon:yes stop_codon:yes gene_type:complete